MNLTGYQKKIEQILRPVRHPRIGCIIGLTEEIGEICKEIMALEIYSKDGNRENLKNEIADAFISISELASSYKIDLEKAVNDKLDSLCTSVPGWIQKFGKNLEKKRKKLD
jgi:NTP pyrophosphatase (non-canonical NTP hydrolase)